LEQLGVRWFLPGPLGTVIPESKTLTLKEQESVQAPSFPSRWFQMPDRDWQVRVRCGGPVFPGGHGLHGLPKFADAPDLYALVGGKRTPRQHCLSNPKVLDLVVADVIAKRKKGLGPIIGMGPNDGRGFCECEHCKRLDAGDFDPFSNEPSVTDRYVWFFNRVLERLGPDHKDVRIAFYIYHSYMRPPVTNKPDPRIMGALAPIALDRVHGFSNPVAPEKSYAKWLYQEWGKLMPELYDRGYWSNLSDPGLPFIIVHRLRDEIPACHELGVKGPTSTPSSRTSPTSTSAPRRSRWARTSRSWTRRCATARTAPGPRGTCRTTTPRRSARRPAAFFWKPRSSRRARATTRPACGWWRSRSTCSKRSSRCSTRARGATSRLRRKSWTGSTRWRKC
jgi:hypothetical protein